jgi:carbon-monoxide dehydrogenase medium subunit
VKPAPFAYHVPETTAEAVALLDELGRDAAVLAGGQSLLPLMSMRLATPAYIVDINGIPELDRVDVGPDGVRVWACARLADLERNRAALDACPLLGHGLKLVAHPVIRTRSTACGSVAHADPAAELPAALALLGGTVRIVGAAGAREVPARLFALGPFEPALAAGELVESVLFPRHRGGSAFVEVSRRHGDFAVCGVAAVIERSSARVAIMGAGPVPQVVELDGRRGRDAAALVRDAVTATSDIHATAEYRRHVAGVLTVRALEAAAAQGGSP